ncbi:MAG TPA: DUF4465 domain-containing protein [Tepidisphaeraceae bacterium]|jgi:hypothetical protein|nr:DUF4465 domain-containing protein [Tepidisphaeraceae bacterium]
MKLRAIISTIFALSASVASATTYDFEELNPTQRPEYGVGTTGFVSEGMTFSGGTYNGWTYSDDTDASTGGYENEYSAFTGIGFNGSSNYAIVYNTGHVNLPAGQALASVRVTNTTLTAKSLQQGDQFAKKFGGDTGNDPDYFDVRFVGYAGANATGGTTGSVAFRLADYTFEDNSQDYIVATWELVDLTPLGNAVSFDVEWASSDRSTYGGVDYINTPLYAAIDNLVTVAVPEPSSLAFLLAAGLLLQRRRRLD